MAALAADGGGAVRRRGVLFAGGGALCGPGIPDAYDLAGDRFEL